MGHVHHFISRDRERASSDWIVYIIIVIGIIRLRAGNEGESLVTLSACAGRLGSMRFRAAGPAY